MDVWFLCGGRIQLTGQLHLIQIQAAIVSPKIRSKTPQEFKRKTFKESLATASYKILRRRGCRFCDARFQFENGNLIKILSQINFCT